MPGELGSVFDGFNIDEAEEIYQEYLAVFDYEDEVTLALDEQLERIRKGESCEAG